MKLFDKLFKKKPTALPSTAPKSDKANEAALRAILDEFVAQTSVPSITLKARRGSCGLTDSKFGGVPYWPQGLAYPRDGDRKPLRLLAQLNFGELPRLENFPSTGILQFFTAADVMYGADFDNQTEQRGFRVVYHEDAAADALDECDFPEPDDESCFPFEGEFLLEPEPKPCAMSCDDFRFSDVFMPIGRRHIAEPKDMPDAVLDAVREKLEGSGNRIGGYPCFTQGDPRDYNISLRGHSVLLLQIDSCGDNNGEIMWGDSGVANFFIKPEDLASCRFDNVLYTWDCC